MSCDCPNIGIFKRGLDGKRELVRMFQYVPDKMIDNYYKDYCDLFVNKSDTEIKYQKTADGYHEIMLLPCGKCVGCRLEYSRQWAMRCTLEALQHERNYFVTLTYDEFSLPTNPYKVCCDPETGLVTHDGHSHPLVPDDLKKFIKDLRRYYEYHYKHKGIRFFACGEYGGKTARPHFHIILFNCPILDLELYKRNFQGKPYFNSKTFDKIWNKGYTVIAECCFDTCAYVARYIMKKQTGVNSDIYDYLDITPEFTRMSRKPGIGRTYFDENHGKIYTYDQVTLLGADGKAMQPCPPKYFDKIYAELEPDHFEEVKQKRLVNQAITERSREYETGLKKSTHIKLVSEQRNRALIALKRVN